MKLAELLDRYGLDVLDHLEREVTIPVVDGLQAQGDLIVIPLDLFDANEIRPSGTWRPVWPGGVELVRAEDGNNPHTLIATAGQCLWTNSVWDHTGLGIAVFENTEPVYLVHPEHGGSGIAAGRWLVRRQRERGVTGRGNVLVAD